MKISAVSSEICEIKNDAQKLLLPVVEAHAEPGLVRLLVVKEGCSKGFLLNFRSTACWLAGSFQLENL